MNKNTMIQLILSVGLIVTGCDGSSRRPAVNNERPSDEGGRGTLTVSKKEALDSAKTVASKGPSAQSIKLGETVISLRKKGDINGALDAMARLMLEWSPIGLPREDIIKVLGEPDQNSQGGMYYLLDTGRYACQWVFETRDNVVTNVTKKLGE